MFEQNQPPRHTLAPYQPYQAGVQPMDDFSFRFGEGESLKGVWSVVRKRKIGIAVGGCIGIALALAVCLLMTRQYLATATIEIGKTDESQTSLRLNAAPAPPSPDDLKTDIATHLQVLQSSNLLLAVVRDLKLQQEAPFKFEPTILGALTGTNAHIEDEMKRGVPLEQAPYSRDRILAIFAKKLKIENTPDTRLITVEYLNPRSDRAATIANAIVQEYVNYEARSQGSSDAHKWLTDELDELKANYQNSQDALAAFEQKSGLNGMVLTAMGEGGAGAQTHVPAIDSLDALNQQLTAAQTDRIAKEAVYRLTKTQDPEVVASIAASSGSGNAASETAVSGPGLELLRSFRQQQAALRVTYADMLTKYGANNQHLLETKSQLDTVNAQIAEELGRINERAHQEYLFAVQKEDGLKKAVATQETVAGSLNVSSVKLQSLSEQATSSRQLYDALYGKLKELDIQSALRATNIGIASPALPPAKPTRPNPPLYLAIGLIAGLFFGVSSAFVREHMDDTVRVGLQLQGGAPLPMLANIPASRNLKTLPSKATA